MGIQIKGGKKPKRNEPCICGSGLKFKKCHGDGFKVAVCNRVANEKMVELIRAEQRKKIIQMQQADCGCCSGTGKIDNGKCACQSIDENEIIKNQYKK